MSILRLATLVAVFGLANFEAYGQQVRCDSSVSENNVCGHRPFRCGPLSCAPRGVPMVFGRLGCGVHNCPQGSGAPNQSPCLTADELWAGFSKSMDCQGCVRQTHFRPSIPGLGGWPACGLKNCSSNSAPPEKAKMGSIYWLQPMPLGNLKRDALSPGVFDGLNILGQGKPATVRRDILNDNFGKLGESQLRLETIQGAIKSNDLQGGQKASAREVLTIPPAPVVEPVLGSDDLPSVDNAVNLKYRKIDWSR